MAIEDEDIYMLFEGDDITLQESFLETLPDDFLAGIQNIYNSSQVRPNPMSTPAVMVAPVQQGSLSVFHSERRDTASTSPVSNPGPRTPTLDIVFVHYERRSRTKKRKRSSPNVVKACEACRKSKRRCDGQQGCRQCVKSGTIYARDYANISF
ncbi:hypothetical protein BC936DRAFT_137087 [Jimgerdemannia flammicorona]|uniref:Zn(2)-C6 fungal-type domain-containing protein n=1 Tax=Jimgerdemannia flammicorona TaxID=994334 RepID=A0A433CY34_9FUNG|nr:hypothetical protein BC936DRAFT_137087 [Jimgerdemannia flammicorona]